MVERCDVLEEVEEGVDMLYAGLNRGEFDMMALGLGAMIELCELLGVGFI